MTTPTWLADWCRVRAADYRAQMMLGVDGVVPPGADIEGLAELRGRAAGLERAADAIAARASVAALRWRAESAAAAAAEESDDAPRRALLRGLAAGLMQAAEEAARHHG